MTPDEQIRAQIEAKVEIETTYLRAMEDYLFAVKALGLLVLDVADQLPGLFETMPTNIVMQLDNARAAAQAYEAAKTTYEALR